MEPQHNLLLPNSTAVLSWSLIFSVIIFVYFGTTLFQICFQTQVNEIFNKSYLSLSVLLFCIIDTAIYINIAVVVKGKLMKNRSRNIRSYCKSLLFLTDMLVVISLVTRIILGLIDLPDYSLVLSILDLFIILKFHNISNYGQILKFYYFDQWSLLIFEFTRNVILVAFLCHVVGCLFYMIDIVMIKANWYPNEQYWLYQNGAYPLLIHQSKSTQYLYSFYFAIVTLSTIAYGDITPVNPTEVLFVLVILSFLLMFYIYIFSQIYEVVNWFYRKRSELEESKFVLARFLKNQKISMSLSCRILSQYEYRVWEDKKVDVSFVEGLNDKLAKMYYGLDFKMEEDKYQYNHFIPYFINKCKIQLSIFNQCIEQVFLLPQQEFLTIQFNQQHKQMQYFMFFIPQQEKINRILSCGTSQIMELAQTNSWLGVLTFLTGQPPNEQYKPTDPITLRRLSCKKLVSIFKSQSNCEHYHKFLQECHQAMYYTEFIEDNNKCLLCWEGHHNVSNCAIYRPEIRRNRINAIRAIRSVSFVFEREKFKIRPRCMYTRAGDKQKSKKMYNLQAIKPHQSQTSIGVQTDELLTNTIKKWLHNPSITLKENMVYQKIAKISFEEVVMDWNHYMPQFNVCNYTNLAGRIQKEIKQNNRKITELRKKSNLNC